LTGTQPADDADRVPPEEEAGNQTQPADDADRVPVSTRLRGRDEEQVAGACRGEQGNGAQDKRVRDEGEAGMTDADTTERDADVRPTEDISEDMTTADTGTDEADDLEERLVAEGELAGDYLEELLDLLDFDGDIDLDVEGDRAVVSIDGSDDLTKLVGPRGEVLDALQELTRLAVHQKTGVRSRLMLDIASWRRRRREELAALGNEVARRVLETGGREELAPMTPFERKIIHDAVAEVRGVRSESEGIEPSRRVVILCD